MEKRKFYINLATHEISQIPFQNNASFVIHATDSDVQTLRGYFDNMHYADMRTYVRSNIPIMPYHHDADNDIHDGYMMNAMKMLHDLGDDTTKNHIKEMDILGDKY